MHRISNAIIKNIAEYFDLPSYGVFFRTRKEYYLMRNIKLFRCEIKNLVSPVAHQPIIRHLHVQIDEPNHYIYDMLRDAHGLQSLSIDSKMEIQFGPESKQVPSIPSIYGLTSLHVNCPIFRIDEALPMSLISFRAVTMIGNVHRFVWPQLQIFEVYNPDGYHELHDPPVLTHLTSLKKFTHPCVIDKVSSILPATVQYIDAHINDIDIQMPDLMILIAFLMPHHITNCPNLITWQGYYHPQYTTELAKLQKLDAIWTIGIDQEMVMGLAKLPYLRIVGNYHHPPQITPEDFQKYLPRCNLYDGYKLIIARKF